MHLSKGEFSSFNLKSRLALLNQTGILLFNKPVDQTLELKVYSIYGYFVEVHYHHQEKRYLKIEPIVHDNWLLFYLDSS